MKSLLVLLAAGSLSLSAQTVVGTKHDLSSTTGPSGKTNITQTCVFCHTPHGAASGAAQLVPLWNNATTAITGFTMYASPTLNGTVTPIAGASLACFSCHDGTAAVGNILNLPSGTATVTYTAGGLMSATGLLTGAAVVDKNLTNDHPVSVTYSNVADTGLKAPTGFPANTVRLFPSNVNGAKVECASCHNVHSNANAPFLRVSMVNSALCLTCHSK